MTIIPTSDALDQTTVMRQVRKLADCINSRDGGLIENIELTEDNQVYTMTITYANGQTQELEWDSVSVGIADITIGYNDGIYTFTFLLTDGTTKTFTIPIGDVVTEEELTTALALKADKSDTYTKAEVNTLDVQNVKKTGTSVVTGDIQVPTSPVSGASVVNSAYVNDTTDGVNNIVHKSGNELITGTKTFGSNYNDSIYIGGSDKGRISVSISDFGDGATPGPAMNIVSRSRIDTGYAFLQVVKRDNGDVALILVNFHADGTFNKTIIATVQ